MTATEFKVWLVENNHTQASLAKVLGMSTRTIENNGVHTMKASKLVKSQKKTFTLDSGKLNKSVCTVDGVDYRKVQMTIRFDDQCNNGHNSFSMTGEAHEVGERKTNWSGVHGCIHEILEVAFPEFKHLIKWHLCSTDGPMHYLADTLYHARTCSHEGKKVGEPVRFERFVTLGNSSYPIKLSNTVIDCLDDAQRFVDTYSEYGMAIVKRPIEFAKAVKPDLEAARRSAVWEDATLEQLQDKELLIGRLPALIEEMRSDIESIGMEW